MTEHERAPKKNIYQIIEEERRASSLAIANASFRNGFYMEVRERTEPFWLYIGELFGWGKFARLIDRHAGVNPELFELVALQLQEPSPDQGQQFSGSNVLWRRQEAIKAELAISAYLRDLRNRGE